MAKRASSDPTRIGMAVVVALPGERPVFGWRRATLALYQPDDGQGPQVEAARINADVDLDIALGDRFTLLISADKERKR